MEFILETDNKVVEATKTCTLEEEKKDTVFTLVTLEKDGIDLSLSTDWIKNSTTKFNKGLKNKAHQGPIGVSNWLSKNLCVGGSIDYKSHLNLFVRAGIDVFVSLIGTDKVKLGLYDYEKDLPDGKIYITEPIEDMNIISDDKILTLARRIAEFIRGGFKVFIHCSGGHGRTGTVAAVVLHLLYGLPLYQIRDYLQYSHDQRANNYFGEQFYNFKLDEDDILRDCFQEGQVPTPQVGFQLNQVGRIINSLI
jgi:protein-tyrosine phosphatase